MIGWGSRREKIMSRLLIPALAMATIMLGCASAGTMESAGPPKPKKCSIDVVGASPGDSSELAFAAVLLGALLTRRGEARRRGG